MSHSYSPLEYSRVHNPRDFQTRKKNGSFSITITNLVRLGSVFALASSRTDRSFVEAYGREPNDRESASDLGLAADRSPVPYFYAGKSASTDRGKWVLVDFRVQSSSL